MLTYSSFGLVSLVVVFSGAPPLFRCQLLKGLRGIGAGALGCGWVREVAPVGGGDEGDS